MKFIVLIFFILAISFLGFRTIRQNVKEDLAKPVILPSPTPTPKPEVKGVVSNATSKRSVFVPYWSLNSEDIEGQFDSYLYFGVSPAGSGAVNKTETGYINIGKFLKSAPEGSDKKLVVRMLDSNTTFPILKDSAKQRVLIRDAISIAKENGFSGIVLDLELSAVPFDSLINQINQFTKTFHEEAKRGNTEFGIMFYGDTFYRLRPFDIKALSQNADEFMIMSYDFSKSRGNPGPNFPLRGKEVYGYDMTSMVDDFLRFLPPEKTTVVFGLFGYDWAVDDKGTATAQGSPLTYKQIEEKFLVKCEFSECSIRRKNDSTETEVRYTDESGKKHIVWFEDMESVKAKQNYLKTRGISNFSFWAHSYF